MKKENNKRENSVPAGKTQAKRASNDRQGEKGEENDTDKKSKKQRLAEEEEKN